VHARAAEHDPRASRFVARTAAWRAPQGASMGQVKSDDAFEWASWTSQATLAAFVRVHEAEGPRRALSPDTAGGQNRHLVGKR
jgi:hypothetical protein